MTELSPHIAITVPDLEEAETYYAHLFDMELITREALTEDGDRQLPLGKTWADAETAGIDLYMLALRRDRFVLALFAETSEHVDGVRRPLYVGLRMTDREVAELRRRLLHGEVWDEQEGGFRDRYGIGWQVSSEGEFRGSGARGRWIAIQ